VRADDLVALLRQRAALQRRHHLARARRARRRAVRGGRAVHHRTQVFEVGESRVAATATPANRSRGCRGGLTPPRAPRAAAAAVAVVVAGVAGIAGVAVDAAVVGVRRLVDREHLVVDPVFRHERDRAAVVGRGVSV
jgi:hypothetical protein